MTIEKSEPLTTENINRNNPGMLQSQNHPAYGFRFFGKRHCKDMSKVHNGFIDFTHPPIAGGAHGTIYRIRVEKEDNAPSNHVKCIKIYSKDTSIELIQNEFIHANQAPHTGVRQPVKIDSEHYGMVMNLQYGKDLFYWISENIDGKIWFSVAGRLKITHLFLLALKHQVHSLKKPGEEQEIKLVHGDLKPENVMLFIPSDETMADNSVPKEATLSIIDYESAKIDDQEKDGTYGTIIYFAPEFIEAKNYRTTIDIYAAGKALFLLWLAGGPNIPLMYYSPFNSGSTIIPDPELLNYYFQGFKRILNSASLVGELPFIKQMLQDMTEIEPEKRPDIDQLIQYFEQKYKDYLDSSTLAANMESPAVICNMQGRKCFTLDGVEYEVDFSNEKYFIQGGRSSEEGETKVYKTQILSANKNNPEKKVVKRFPLSSKNSKKQEQLKTIKQEYKNSRLAPHLNCSKPIVDNNIPNHPYAMLIMNKQPGKDLFSLFDGTKEFSIEFRINLMYQLLKQFNRQISDTVIHGDIKPENIIVKIKEDKIRAVNFIDFEWAFKKGQQPSFNRSVSNMYRAPELINNPQALDDELSQRYSLGKTIAFIWLDALEMIYQNDSIYEQYFSETLIKTAEEFQNLFKVKQLPELLKPMFSLIENLIAPKPEDRKSIGEHLSMLDKHYKKIIQSDEILECDNQNECAAASSSMSSSMR